MRGLYYNESYRNRLQRHEWDSAASVCSPQAGFCDQNDKLLGSINNMELLDQLNNYKLLKHNISVLSSCMIPFHFYLWIIKSIQWAIPNNCSIKIHNRIPFKQANSILNIYFYTIRISFTLQLLFPLYSLDRRLGWP